MIIDWLNSYDKSKSVDWNQAELTNWYLMSNQRGKLPLAAYPTPGSTMFSPTSTDQVECRGGITYNDIPYVVIDNQFLSMDSAGNRTVIGTLLTTAGLVSLANITDQIVIVDGTYGYQYDLGTAIFQQITDIDFPANATSITASDDIFFVCTGTSPHVNFSDISNGLSWPALNILEKTRHAENVLAVKALNGLVWFYGRTTIEPYFNSGTDFERDSTSMIQCGVSAPNTIVDFDNVQMFLSERDTGGIRIVQAVQGNFTPISMTIDYQLKQMTSVRDAFAYKYSLEGNDFYNITFPTDGITFSYNVTTQSWNKISSNINGADTRHFVNFTISCFNKILVGDFQSGNIFILDTDVYTENTTPIKRILVTYPFYKEGLQITGSRLIVEFETGVGSNSAVDLYYSKDGNHTFTLKTPGRTVGTNFGERLIYDRFGQARQWAFRVETSMTSKCIMLGAVGTFTVGVS